MCRPTSARAAQPPSGAFFRPSGIFRLDPLRDRVDLGSRRPHRRRSPAPPRPDPLRLIDGFLPAFALLLSDRFLLCPLSVAALQLSLGGLSGLAILPLVRWGGRFLLTAI